MNHNSVRLVVTMLCLMVVFACSTKQKVEPQRSYNSLASLDLLEIPKDFLPEPGKCKIWFPKHARNQQPYSSSCNTAYFQRRIDQIVIENQGTKEEPIYYVMDMKVAEKGGHIVNFLYFADKDN